MKLTSFFQFIYSFFVNKNIYSRCLSIVFPTLGILSTVSSDNIIYRYFINPANFIFYIHEIRIGLIQPLYGLVFTPIGFVLLFSIPIVTFYFIGVILGNIYNKAKRYKFAVCVIYFTLATFLFIRSYQFKKEFFATDTDDCPKQGMHNHEGLGREQCLIELALSQNNIAICDLIEDEIYVNKKAYCIESFKLKQRRIKNLEYDKNMLHLKKFYQPSKPAD